MKTGCVLADMGTVADPARLVFLGVPFHNVTFDETIAWSLKRIRCRRPGYIVAANLDFLMQAWKDPELQRILIDADLVIADGMSVVMLSGFFGPKLKERVMAGDLVSVIAGPLAENGMSVFGLGAAPGMAQTALDNLQRANPGLKIAGAYSPPNADILDMNNSEIVDTVSKAEPDMLLLAFGAPKQEKWINMNIDQLNVPVSIGIGESLDFIAGAQKRAPKVFRAVGMECFWRMLSNPKRLSVRYIKNIFFLMTAIVRVVFIRFFVSGRIANPVEIDPQDLAKFQAQSIPYENIASEMKSGRLRALTKSATERLAPVLDLRSVKWLNSVEIGTLLDLSRECGRNGKRLYLVNVTPRIKRFLMMSRLHHYLQMPESVSGLAADLRILTHVSDSWIDHSADESQVRIMLPMEITAANRERLEAELEKVWVEVVSPRPDHSLFVDASGLDFVDSSGLGFLASLNKRAVGENRQIVWHGFHGKARKTIEISRMEAVFRIN